MGLTGNETFEQWLDAAIKGGALTRTRQNIVQRAAGFGVGNPDDFGLQGPDNPLGSYSTKELQRQYDRWRMLKQQAGQQASDAAQAAKEPNVDAEIEAFYQKMMELRPDDPEVQQAMQFAGSQATNEAKLRGIDGSIAVSEVARQGQQGLNSLRQFRQGLGLQALGLKTQRAQGLAAIGEQARQFDYGAAQNAYGNRIGTGQAIGGLVGGIAGSYFGPVGSAAGSAIGGGIGGYVAGATAPGGYPQPPSYGSYGNGGGGPTYGRGY